MNSSDQAIADLQELRHNVFMQLVEPGEVGPSRLQPVEQFITTQSHGLVSVTTYVRSVHDKREGTCIYVSFVTPSGERTYIYDNSVIVCNLDNERRYELDANDEIRALFNAVLIFKARERKAEKERSQHVV